MLENVAALKISYMFHINPTTSSRFKPLVKGWWEGCEFTIYIP